jgi:hypothetical protein
MKRLLAITALLCCSVSGYAIADDKSNVLDPHVGGYVGLFGGYRFSGSFTDVRAEGLGLSGTATNINYDGDFLGGVKTRCLVQSFCRCTD